MKFIRVIGLASTLGLGVMPLVAQEAGEVEQLRRQIKQLQDQFEKQQQIQRQQIEALQQQVEALQGRQAAPPAVAQKAILPPLKPQPLAAAPAPAGLQKTWDPAAPIRVGSSSAYADLGLVGTFAAGSSTARDIEGGTQLGGHDPNQRGFSVQSLELNLVGNVDPYFRANANILFQIDRGGESFVEVEEAYMDTLALPGNLQIRGGQFLSEFGRLNPTHPHTWSFVDQSLVNARFLGADGLRNPGGRISWLLPTPFYSELFLSVQDSQGETAQSFRNDHAAGAYLGRFHTVDRAKSFVDMLFVPRYAASFDLTDSQTLLLGASGAFGPNASGTDTRTQIYGLDAFWKWKPANHHGGFPFVSWQTEAMLRKYTAGAFSNAADDTSGDGTIGDVPGETDIFGDGLVHTAPRETLTDYGLYSQVSYGFRQGWVAALRGDYVARSRQAAYESLYGDDPDRTARWRLAPNLTWYPSEFSKIRLQYNYDWRDFIGPDHSVWLQFEFLLGAHAAHKF